MHYEINVSVESGGIVAFHEQGFDPDRLNFDFVNFQMLMWSNESRSFGVSSAAMVGAIKFSVDQYVDDPGDDTANRWEGVEEVSANFRGSVFELMDWEGAQPHIPPIELTSKPGPHRLRMYGLGRKEPVELQDPSDPDINERYLLQIWPESELRAPSSMRMLR